MRKAIGMAGVCALVAGTIASDASADTLDTWNKVTVFATQSPQSVTQGSLAFGNGWFVGPGNAAPGTPTTVSRSNDGVTWQQVSTPATAVLTAVGFANGQFVASFRSTYNGLNHAGIVASSADGGATWQQRATVAETPSCLTYINGTWLGCVMGGVLKSTDGVTWTKTALTGPSTASTVLFSTIAFGNGVYVATGGGSPWSSTDAVTWTPHTLPASGIASAVAYGNGAFVAAGILSTWKSTDGVTWTPSPSPNGAWYMNALYANGEWIVAGTTKAAPPTATLATSPDGATWTARTAPVSDNFRAIAYGQQRVVGMNAVGGTGLVAWWSGPAPALSRTGTSTGGTVLRPPPITTSTTVTTIPR